MNEMYNVLPVPLETIAEIDGHISSGAITPIDEGNLLRIGISSMMLLTGCATTEAITPISTPKKPYSGFEVKREHNPKTGKYLVSCPIRGGFLVEGDQYSSLNSASASSSWYVNELLKNRVTVEELSNADKNNDFIIDSKERKSLLE